MGRHFRWCGSLGTDSPDKVEGSLPSFLGTKKKGEAWGDFEGTICPVFRCSSMKDLHVSISARLSEWILATLGVKSGWSSIVWS